jgi:4'-phosphopantetheinyl transferase EntD
VIAESLAAALPASFVVEWLSPLPESLPIQGAEAAIVAGAVPRRQREFAAGRWLAARALHRLGLPRAPLLAGAGREPRWPDSITGSISHCGDACVVLAAKRQDIRSVGIDLEEDAPLERSLLESICTAAELTWLLRQPDSEQGGLAKLLFSAKEAFYKFQYPLTATFLEFQDVEVSLSPGSNGLEARLIREHVTGLEAGYRAHGVWLREDGYVATVFFERASAAAEDQLLKDEAAAQ